MNHSCIAIAKASQRQTSKLSTPHLKTIKESGRLGDAHIFAETLVGIALVKSEVNGFKFANGTARDISEIADDINKLFTGEQQIQKKKQNKSSSPFTVGSVARETIDAKLAALATEHGRKIATLIDLHFCHGTWQSIINERANRL